VTIICGVVFFLPTFSKYQIVIPPSTASALRAGPLLDFPVATLKVLDDDPGNLVLPPVGGTGTEGVGSNSVMLAL
jgi:predicted benzoate:H+ symporter BenE